MDRKLIKSRAKEALRASYWLLVGIFVVVSIVSSASFFLTYDFTNVDLSSLDAFWESVSQQRFGGSMKLQLGLSLLNVLITFFVTNVISVGAAKVALKAYRGEEFSFRDLFFGFSNSRYLRIVGAMALVTLIIGAGFLFCIVPGIIAALGLSQVPMILADSDTEHGIMIEPMVAVGASWQMMKGRKGEFFVFGLSFIGWVLLALVTLGLSDVFYSAPYISISRAGWYDETDKAMRGYAY